MCKFYLRNFIDKTVQTFLKQNMIRLAEENCKKKLRKLRGHKKSKNNKKNRKSMLYWFFIECIVIENLT